MKNQISRIALAGLGCLLAIGAGIASCNNHPAEYREAGGAVEHLTTVSAGAGGKIDLLWVIDNSGSMCEEQQSLRDNFEAFMETLDKTPVDFNMGVTTTHFKPPNQSGQEVIARPGQLQYTPHPPVSYFKGCASGNWKAVRDQVNAAVDCAKNPDQFSDLRDPSEDLVKCATQDSYSNCPGGRDPENFKRHDLFPCANAKGSKCETRQDFRNVYQSPKGQNKHVIRASNYRNPDNSLKLDQLKQDFKCMSFVGTRGSTFEAGLKAAARAVSPVKTGGPEGNPYESGKKVRDRVNDRNAEDEKAMAETKGKDAPNHGLIRPGAKTAILFVTDENDCSSPNNQAQLQNSCGQMTCYFPQSDEWSEDRWTPGKGESTPLLETVPSLAERLRANLADSKKKDELDPGELIVGSIHGNYERYGSKSGQTIPESEQTRSGKGPNCTSTQQQNLVDTLDVCNTDRGTAKSGDRYADFLGELRSADFVTIPGKENSRRGFMCRNGSLKAPLEAIAEEFRPDEGNCITKRVLPCRTGSDNPDCPGYQFDSSGAGELCQQWGNSSGQKNGFCSSAIRLQLEPASDDASFEEDLSDERNRFCIEESIGVDGSDTCVMKRSFYSWETCQGNDNAIQIAWNSSKIQNAARELGALEVKARYTEVVEASLDEGGDNGGDQSGGNNQSN